MTITGKDCESLGDAVEALRGLANRLETMPDTQIPPTTLHVNALVFCRGAADRDECMQAVDLLGYAAVGDTGTEVAHRHDKVHIRTPQRFDRGLSFHATTVLEPAHTTLKESAQ